MLLAAVPWIGTVAAEVRPGEWVSYRLGGQDVYCGRVTSVFAGPGGAAWVWIQDRDAPARVFKLPVVDTTPGCR